MKIQYALQFPAFQPYIFNRGVEQRATYSLITPVWGRQLRNVIFNIADARSDQGFADALIRVSCRCVIDVMFLDCVCCARFIGTRITVCSVSFHLLLQKFDSSSIGVWSTKGRTSKFAGVSCRPRFVWNASFCGAGACGVVKAIYKQFCNSHFGLCCWF